MRWNNAGFRTLALTALAGTVLNLGASPQNKKASPTPQPSATPRRSPSPAKTPQMSTEKQKHAQPEFLVLIDASHGGDDRGLVFAAKLFEKDVTLALARELSNELEERGISARLLRESDASISLDRRAEIANEQRGGVYVGLHAGYPGRGVRVYSAMLDAPSSAAKARFLPWETAQAGWAERSKALAKSVFRELQKKNIEATGLRAPLRPLNNIVEPAIAVEIAPEQGEPRSRESLRRLNAVASAIASGIAQMRGQMGTRP